MSMTGKVKWFNESKGYGFITIEDDGDNNKQDCFVHYSSIEGDGYRTLTEGESVTFELVENDWRLSSRGMEFNEGLFAATLQELIFGEIFQTRQDPLARDSLEVAGTPFDPTYFRLVNDHLVVEVAGAPARGTR